MRVKGETIDARKSGYYSSNLFTQPQVFLNSLNLHFCLYFYIKQDLLFSDSDLTYRSSVVCR